MSSAFWPGEPIRKRFVLAVFCLCLVSRAYAEDKLIFLTEEWKPFNYKGREKAVTGFTTEIVEKISSNLGSDISIAIKPWSRSYNTVLKNEHHAIFSIYRTAAREKLFKWVGPVYRVDTVLWGLESRKLQIQTLEDAKKYHVIVQKDSAYEQVLKEEGFPKYYVNASKTDAQMVLMGRGDLTVASALSLGKLKKAAMDVNKPDEKWKAYVVLYSEPFYIAFNKKTPDPVVRRWQTALDQVKKHAFYSQLEIKYIQPLRGHTR